jgi:hypothetical protein
VPSCSDALRPGSGSNLVGARNNVGGGVRGGVRVSVASVPPSQVDVQPIVTHDSRMAVASTRVERIVSLVEELTSDERNELADRLGGLESAGDPRSRVAAAIRRVVTDHPQVLAALAK